MEPWWAIMLEVMTGGGLGIVGVARWLWLWRRKSRGKDKNGHVDES